MTFIALTVAGSDSGGGAGVQADIKTFSALGVYGASVITALTAQNTRAVTMVEPVSGAMIRAQMDAVLDDLAVGAVKLGMLGGIDAIEAVADRLRAHCGDGVRPVVLDPVMVAKSGDLLLPDEAIGALVRHVLPLADIITPNIPEAACLLGAPPAASLDAMTEQGRSLLALGPKAVLMKGGHARGPQCVDLLITADGVVRFEAPRLDTRNTHGTGCTLSAAIAAGLAGGGALEDAVRRAHAYLQGAIAAADGLGADGLGIGHGNGPVHHFHAMWPPSVVPSAPGVAHE